MTRENNLTMTDAYKNNTIKIAKHHRKYCEGMECDISLHLLMKMAERVGVTFTKEERKVFL